MAKPRCRASLIKSSMRPLILQGTLPRKSWKVCLSMDICRVVYSVPLNAQRSP